MRQPEVARLAALLLGLVLVLPVVAGLWSLVVTAAFLLEFLADGAARPLSRLTASPTTIPAEAGPDRYQPRGVMSLLAGGNRPLVLVHGLTPEGKDDPRVRTAARLLARAGFDVRVPDIAGLRRGRLRPDDIEPVVATLATFPRPGIVIGVSVGAGPALLAAADPRVRARVTTVLSLGGYASARELVAYYLTGRYAFGDVRGERHHDPALIAAFVAANRDLLDPRLAAALARGDADEIATMLAAPPPPLHHLLSALSPERVAADIQGRLILVHGRADPAVPYTETLRLAAARPIDTTVVLVGVVGHVEGQGQWAWRHGPLDILRVGAAFYAVLVSGPSSGPWSFPRENAKFRPVGDRKPGDSSS